MQIESMVNDIEDKTAILSKGSREIDSKVIGDLILEQLGIIDKVAYIRFASVYRHFENLDEFVQEIHLLGRGTNTNAH
jgi:transcriptional repressor NrdR